MGHFGAEVTYEAEQPLVCFVDDVDRLSDDDLGNLRSLVLRSNRQNQSLLWVLTCRDLPKGMLCSTGSSSDHQPHCETSAGNIRDFSDFFLIPSMSAEETGSLMADLTGRAPSLDLRSSVAGITGGNPLLVQQLTARLVSEGGLQVTRRGLELTRSVILDELSRSMGPALTWPFDAGLPQLTHICRLVSLGPGVTSDVLSEVTGVDRLAIMDMMADLAMRGILREPGYNKDGAYRAELLRIAVYESIDPPLRHQLHVQIADAWLDRSGRREEDHRRDAVLAWHLSKADRVEDSVGYACRAASSLVRQSRVSESLPYLEILEVVPIEVLDSMNGALGKLHSLAQGYWALGAAIPCSRACELGVAMSELHAADDDAVGLAMSALLARAHALSGNTEQAALILEGMLTRAERCSDPCALVQTYYGLCMVRQMQGRFSDMERLSSACVDAAEQSGVKNLIGMACSARGNACMALCEWRAASRWHGKAAESRRGRHDHRALATSLGNIGRAHLYLGEWRESDSFFERSLLLARRSGCAYALGISLCNCGTLRARRGMISEAAKAFADAQSAAELADDVWGLASTLSDFGELEHLRGNEQAALELYTRSEELMHKVGSVDDLPELRRRKAESLIELGEIDEAARLIDSAAELACGMEHRLEIANCLRVQGRLLALQDELEQSAERLRESERMLQELGAKYELAQTSSVLGGVMLLAGDDSEGRKALEEALAMFTALGARRDARLLQERLAAVTCGASPSAEQLPNEKERLAALYRSSRSLSSAQSTDELARDLADIAAAGVLAEAVAVVLVDGDGTATTTVSSLCDYSGAMEEIRSLVLSALSDCGRESSTRVYHADDAPAHLASMLRGLSVRSFALVPIRSGRGVLGALYLGCATERGSFSDDDVRFLEALASQSAVFIDNVRMRARLESEVESLRWVVDSRHMFSSIVGQSLPMQHLFSLLEKVSRTSVTVLVQGESGTGKELVAKAIHLNGPRHDARFVAQNCAALPEQLLESELFGHMRGAFTGAHRDKAGLFEAADGGTFFLDEIADMPVSLQVKLLRVLQEGEIRRVGATDPIVVDVRIIAATNKSLDDEVRAGRFRQDLFYRLDVVRIEMPSLRERRDDIPLLAQHFLNRFCEASGQPPRGFSDRAMDLLVNYDWPGNVRELENEIERAVALSERGTTLTAECLSDRIRSVQIAVHPPKPGTRLSLKNMVEDVEKRVILQVLNENNWNKSRTAEALGLSRQGLLKKIARFGLARDKG
jgi:Nif-specific regulatory protein